MLLANINLANTATLTACTCAYTCVRSSRRKLEVIGECIIQKFVDVKRSLLSNYCEEMETFWFESCVRGHHIYKNVWNPSLGEELTCSREAENTQDPPFCCCCEMKNNHCWPCSSPNDSCMCPRWLHVPSFATGVLWFSTIILMNCKFGDCIGNSPIRQIKALAKVSTYTVTGGLPSQITLVTCTHTWTYNRGACVWNVVWVFVLIEEL